MPCYSDDYKSADRWEFHGGNSHRFWIILEKEDGTYSTWWGRCGKSIVGGKYKTPRKSVAKYIDAKEKKGYVKVGTGYDAATYNADGSPKESSEPPAKKVKPTRAPMAGMTFGGTAVGGEFETVLDFVKAHVAVYKSSSDGPLAKELASDSSEIYKLAATHWGADIQDGKYYYVDIDGRKVAPAVNKNSFEDVKTVGHLIGESIAVWQQCVEENPASEEDPDNFVPRTLKEEQVNNEDATMELDDYEWMDDGLGIDSGYFYWIAKQE